MVQRRSKRKEFPVGTLLFLGVTIFFMVRFVNITLKNDLGGSHAYVQILNLGMPVVEGTYYDEAAYEESTVTIKGIIKQTLGLNNIDTSTILAAQIPRFNDFNEAFVQNELKPDTTEIVDSFVLEDGSIKKEEKPKIDPSGIRNPNIVKTLDQANPQILMVNSHTTEAIGQPRVLVEDPSKNIQGVTELIVKELEDYYGISVIYDKTKHDVFYEQSYYRSKETLQGYKAKYGEGQFNLVIDVHRDGVLEAGGKITPKLKNAITTEINGEKVSRIMFVETTNSGPENYATTNAIAKRMLASCNELFPGLGRDIRTFNNGKAKFNQEVFKNSILIEIGAEISTVAESQATAKYLARLIAEEVYYQENNS